MAIGELFYERMDEAFGMLNALGKLQKLPRVAVPLGCTSKAVGQKRKNIIRLCEKYSLINVKIVEKSSVLGYNIIIDLS